MYPILLLMASTATADAPTPPDRVEDRDDAVLLWNETALQAIKEDRTPPPVAARNLAILHAAIYDAVNAIDRTHTVYHVDAAAPAGASMEAAAAGGGAPRPDAALPEADEALRRASWHDSLTGVPDGPAPDGRAGPRRKRGRQDAGVAGRRRLRPQGPVRVGVGARPVGADAAGLQAAAAAALVAR